MADLQLQVSLWFTNCFPLKDRIFPHLRNKVYCFGVAVCPCLYIWLSEKCWEIKSKNSRFKWQEKKQQMLANSSKLFQWHTVIHPLAAIIRITSGMNLHTLANSILISIIVTGARMSWHHRSRNGSAGNGWAELGDPSHPLCNRSCMIKTLYHKFWCAFKGLALCNLQI